MNEDSDEIRLGALSTEAVLLCPECGILLIRRLMEKERWPPLLGTLGLYCPVCQALLVDLETEEQEKEP